MRLLLQLPYPGYLRMYGSTVAELAGRGHEVLLAYDTEKHRDPAASLIEALAGVSLVGPVGWDGTGARRIASTLRLGADYLRFLDPRFAGAPYLRERMERFAPMHVRRLAARPWARRVAPAAVRAFVAAERVIAPDPATLASLRRFSPDVVVVSPLVARGMSSVRQTDTVKAARKLGIPVGAAIGSWDHLTTKGAVKALPDALFVWNEIQAEEAVELHRVPRKRIVTTGAQLFDQWFAREPSRSREEFAAEAGLEPAEPIVLYVGSSPNITEAAREESFVREWIDAVRGAPGLGAAGILVRPHPGNMGHWSGVDLGRGAAVLPTVRPEIPMSDADEALYFDSIHHAAAVVGINTSAIIESLVQRRPVLTVRADAFRETQEGTLHFHYLLPGSGGAVQAAGSLAEHARQLSEVVARPEDVRDRIDAFLASFVRPHGLDRPATPVLADAIEALARP